MPNKFHSALPATNRHALAGGTVNVSIMVANELFSALNPTLSVCDRQTLFAILLRYDDEFEHSLGDTTVVDSPPIRQCPRKLPYA